MLYWRDPKAFSRNAKKINTNINIEYRRINDIRKVFEWHTAALFPVCFFHVPIPPCVWIKLKKCDGIGKEPRYRALFCCQIIILRLTSVKQVGYDFFFCNILGRPLNCFYL